MSTKNSDIVQGNVELEESEFEPRHVKVRVTTMIDEDVVSALKKIASKKGQKYQTLLNQILRAFTEQKKESKSSSVDEGRVRQIVREELRKRA